MSCRPKRLSEIPAPNILLFVVERCLLAGNVACIESSKSFQWRIPTELYSRFCQPLFYVHGLEVLSLWLSFWLRIIFAWMYSFALDLWIATSILFTVLIDKWYLQNSKYRSLEAPWMSLNEKNWNPWKMTTANELRRNQLRRWTFILKSFIVGLFSVKSSPFLSYTQVWGNGVTKHMVFYLQIWRTVEWWKLTDVIQNYGFQIRSLPVKVSP